MVYPVPGKTFNCATTDFSRFVFASGRTETVADPIPGASVTVVGIGRWSTPLLANPGPGPPRPRLTIIEFNGNPPRVIVNTPRSEAVPPGSGCTQLGSVAAIVTTFCD